MRVSSLLAVAALVVVAVSGVGHAQTVVGQPSLTVSPVDDQFVWGEDGALTLSVANDGTVVAGGPAALEERVTTARNVRLRLLRDRIDGPLARAVSFEQERAVVGRLPDGDATTVGLNLSVGQAISPGVYELPLVLSYEYTTIAERVGDVRSFNDREREVVVRIPIRVLDRPRIRLTAAENQTVTAGTTTRFRVAVTNTGTEPASELGITLRTDNVTTQFGSVTDGGPATWLYIDSLDPGERRVRTIALRALPETTTGTYLVAGTARYRRPGGFEERTDSLRFGIQITAVDRSVTAGRPSATQHGSTVTPVSPTRYSDTLSETPTAAPRLRGPS